MRMILQPEPAAAAAEPRADDPLLLRLHHRPPHHLLDLHQAGQQVHQHLHQNIYLQDIMKYQNIHHRPPNRLLDLHQAGRHDQHPHQTIVDQ